MSLTIRIISAPDDHLTGRPSQYYFDGKGGTIGCDAQSDIVLSDPQAHIDETHAVIHYADGIYIITDNSRDGLFINNQTDALGQGQQHPLHDGDMLGIGGYRLLVSCFTPQSLTAEEPDDSHGDSALRGLFTPAQDDIRHYADDPFMSGRPVKQPEAGAAETAAVPDPAAVPEMPGMHEMHDIPAIPDIPALRSEADTLLSPEPLLSLPEETHDPVSDHLSDHYAGQQSDYHTGPQPDCHVPADQAAQWVAVSSSDTGISSRLALTQALLPEISRALCVAAGKIIRDISPQQMEALYCDQKQAKKLDYWQAYRHFFSQQTEDDHLQARLVDYFRSEFYTQIIQSK